MEPTPWAEIGVLGAFVVGAILGVIATIRITRIVVEWFKEERSRDERSKEN